MCALLNKYEKVMVSAVSERNTGYTWEREIPLRSHTEDGEDTAGERSGPAEVQGGFVLVCTGLVSHSPHLREWSRCCCWRRWYSHPDFQVMTSSVMISVCDPYWVWARSTCHRSRLPSEATSVRECVGSLSTKAATGRKNGIRTPELS